ncbi:MAG: lysine exporter LysO family protein [Bacillota bacterium]|nr:lysine exporter LysO family protein [Bacillota bacterium]
MTARILTSLALGILAGLFLLPEGYIGVMGSITDLSLALLLFTIGFNLGHDRDLWKKIKDLPRISLVVPVLIALGSLAGAMVVGFMICLPWGDAALVGAGFGWYSLAGVIISQTYDVTLGALALLANVFREILAILLIPLIARTAGRLAAVAPGGATAMDVTLPIISQSTDAQTTLVAFYSGTVLSALVPVVVPLIIQLIEHYA